ncbi:relaxase/mobilization nuclease domain-containing protein, partial [Mucilaginibacter sp. L3T2-6]|uniref:relaxase/mobilization nuclease domain-containing protein n=1 Tax=Mucilaginibacter sp. L3T2-6 TaxID=3062491 RepID=UPI002676FB80
GHIALSWSPNDKDILTDEKMVSIAQAYLLRMKIQDTQVLMVRHKDREHPHVHIIYNRVNHNGKTIADNFQRQKSIKICKSLTLQHGLFIAQDKQNVNRQQLKGIDKVKYELHDAIKAVSQKVYSMNELKQELAKQGIGILYKYKSGSLEKQGITFSKGEFKFKGSELDRSLSYSRLSKQISDQSQVREQQEKTARQQSPVQERRLADQLRQAIATERSRETSRQADASIIDEVFGKLLKTSSSGGGEPEEPRRRRKKGHGEEQDQSMGIGR